MSVPRRRTSTRRAGSGTYFVRATGTTRTVWLVGPWAVKVPSTRKILPHRTTRLHAFARGWCANLSEWHHRDREGVCAPRATVLGVVQVYPRAGAVERSEDFHPPASSFPAPEGITVDRTWPNLGALRGSVVWVDYDQTDQNR